MPPCLGQARPAHAGLPPRRSLSAACLQRSGLPASRAVGRVGNARVRLGPRISGYGERPGPASRPCGPRRSVPGTPGVGRNRTKPRCGFIRSATEPHPPSSART